MNFLTYSNLFRIFTILIALFGIAMILIATSRSGIGISPDSVEYISAARNLTIGKGFLLYNKKPLVFQPPLYPFVLSIFDKIFRVDPLNSARVINSIIFGLIIMLSGFLFNRYFYNFSILAFLGIVSVLFSLPLFKVSVMAWTEPLFIVFVLLFFLIFNNFLLKHDLISFILIIIIAALASLTRYIGVTLIITGIITIQLFYDKDIRTRLTKSILFGIISSLPLVIWITRNYILTGTTFGPRDAATFNLTESVAFTFSTFIAWFLPCKISEHTSILISSGIIGFFITLMVTTWHKSKTCLVQIAPIALFTLIYTTFLVICSVATAFNEINDRYLCPVYIPLILLILFFAERCLHQLRKGPPEWMRRGILISICSCWIMLYPFKIAVSEIENRFILGAGGYSRFLWKNSETCQFIRNYSFQHQNLIYSNVPEALYILMDIKAKMIPKKLPLNKDSIVKKLKGSWPENPKAVLIWFFQGHRKNLYDLEDLQTIANFSTIADFVDGTMYEVSIKR